MAGSGRDGRPVGWGSGGIWTVAPRIWLSRAGSGIICRVCHLSLAATERNQKKASDCECILDQSDWEGRSRKLVGWSPAVDSGLWTEQPASALGTCSHVLGHGESEIGAPTRRNPPSRREGLKRPKDRGPCTPPIPPVDRGPQEPCQRRRYSIKPKKGI